MDALTGSELAERAGCPLQFVDRLVSLGILIPRDGDGAFSPADVYRIRLIRACERGGLSLEGISAAIREGRLSLAFAEQPSFRFAPLADRTYRELAAQSGADLDFLLAFEEAQGLQRPDPDDRVREDLLAMIGIFQLARGAGIDDLTLLRTIRVYADSIRRIAEAEARIYHDQIEMPLLRSGLGYREISDIASQVGAQFTPLQEQALLATYRRQQERVWTEDIVEHIESALEEMGVYRRPARPPAMSFIDLAGYTRLTEERGDEAAAALAGELSGLVQHSAQMHGGRPVKWLGDGVMFYFRDPAAAVVATVEMVTEIPGAGLPPAHAGVAAGPVISQDGDYFGRTVNIASRLAARAGTGQTLVTEEVVSTVDVDRVRFRSIGELELKGLSSPVRVHEALPAERT